MTLDTAQAFSQIGCVQLPVGRQEAFPCRLVWLRTPRCRPTAMRHGFMSKAGRSGQARQFVKWARKHGWGCVVRDVSRRNVRLQRNLARKVPTNHVTDKRKYYRTVYLRSPHWKALKTAKLIANPTCEKCGADYLLDVHHLRYKNLYDVELSDVQTLCRGCHHKEHPEQI